MAFFAHFKAVPYKSFTNNSLKKITRKRQDLQLKHDYFPVKGHVSLKESDSSYLYFGGGGVNESTFANANRIFRISFDISDDDVNIQNIEELSLTGGSFPQLYGSAAVMNSPSTAYVWGGLTLNTCTVTNELIALHLRESARHTRVEIIQSSPSAISMQKMQNTPTGRCGHSFINIGGGKVVLHGGLHVEFPNKKEMCNSKFHLLDLNTLSWSSIQNLPDVPPRAYHSSNLVTISEVPSIVYLGGILSCNSEDIRHSIFDIFCLRILPDDVFEILNLTIPSSVDCKISSHASVFISPFIVVVGGLVNNNLYSNKILHINTIDKTCECVEVPEQLSTAGHSCLLLDNYCILVCGGTSKQYFTYSSKMMAPSACDLGSLCKISNTPEMSPISWIFCEGGCKSTPNPNFFITNFMSV